MPRKQHAHHYIYKVTCNVTGKYYVGMHSTSNLEDGYFGSGKVLKRSLNKYGKANHSIEILEWLPDRSTLKSREKELVNESILSDHMCMNLQIGGGGGFSGEENQKKWSTAGGIGLKNKLVRDPIFRETFGKKSSAILKRSHNEGKIKYNTFIGKTHSIESKQKIGATNSKLQAGEKNSQFGTKWINHPIEGSKKIKETEIDQHLKNGWSFGRK